MLKINVFKLNEYYYLTSYVEHHNVSLQFITLWSKNKMLVKKIDNGYTVTGDGVNKDNGDVSNRWDIKIENDICKLIKI